MDYLFNRELTFSLVPEEFAWFSIQTDAGITLGSLGQLAGEADTSLVGGLLLSLKNLVSSETANKDTRFLEGATEHSAFGVARIESPSVNIYSMFIVSKDSGHVNKNIVETAVELTWNFGRELLHIDNLSAIAESGMQLDHGTLLKAFVKAAIITRFNLDITKSDNSLINEFKSFSEKFLTERKNVMDFIESQFETKGWKIKSDYWKNGHLTYQVQNQIINSLVVELLLRVVGQNPMKLVYTDHKQDIFKKLNNILSDLIINYLPNPSEQVIMQLPKEVKKGYGQSIAKAQLKDLHNVEFLLYDLYVRRALLSIAKEKPLILLVPLSKTRIFRKFKESLPEVKIIDVGGYYLKSLRKFVDNREYRYIEVFFSTFMKGIQGMEATQTTYDFFTTFSTAFTDIGTLKQTMMLLEDFSIDGRWKKELEKRVNAIKAQNIRFQSLIESTVVLDASIKASLETFMFILQDQFVKSIDGEYGYFIETMADLYLTIGPIVKISSVITDLIKTLQSNPLGIGFFVPLPKDFIQVAFQKGLITVFHDEKPISLLKSGNIVINGDEITLSKFFTSFSYSISYESKVYTNVWESLEPTLMLSLLQNSDFLYEVTLNSAIRKIKNQVIDIILDWIENFRKEIEIADKLFLKNQIADQRKFMQLQFDFFSEINIVLDNLPFVIKEVYIQFPKQMKTISNDFMVVWRSIENQSQSYNSSVRKSWKSLRKNVLKNLKSFEKEVLKQFSATRKFIDDILKSSQKQIRNIPKTSAESILNFSGALGSLPEKAVLKQNISNYFNKTQGFLDLEIEEVKLGISLNLFEELAHIFLEEVYNQIITNRKSKGVDKALKQANSKREFEGILAENSSRILKVFYNKIGKLIRIVEDLYLNNDAPVFVSDKNIFLQLGEVKVEDVDEAEILINALNLPDVYFERQTSKWVIKYQLPYFAEKDTRIPDLITLSDAIRFISYEKTKIHFSRVVEGITSMIELINQESAKKFMEILQMIEKIILEN